jgi:hypothetical protein
MKSSAMLLFGLLIPLCISAQDVFVSVDLTKPMAISQFHIGVTHTHGFWEYGNSFAVDNAHDLLVDGVAFQNQHIMGWGAGNPEPQPGSFYWADLDHRIELMRSIGTPMMITFCTAPGWMKETDDWDMEADVKDDYFSDFADLCAAVADRYQDVEYFQVWNEFKGFWSNSLNNWDYKRYTTLYNAVYNAVKTVRPDAQVGGPYLVIQGDGGQALGKNGQDTFAPIGSRDWAVINYWLKNKVGADFMCFDYGLIDYHDTSVYTKSDKMKLTFQFGQIVHQLRVKTDLPIVISEFYGGSDAQDLGFTAANHASCFYHAVLNGATLGLLWNPQQGEIDNYLFTKTDNSAGGQPTPLYSVVELFNNHFSEGTQLYNTASSSDDIEALASAEKTLLINKTEKNLTVAVNGKTVQLSSYQVELMDTPANTRVQDTPSPLSSKVNVVYSSSQPFLQIRALSSVTIHVQVFNILGEKIKEFNRYIDADTNSTIPVFENSRTLPSGVYMVAVHGLERPMVRKILLQK